jgi:hypothetical protein
MMLRDVPNASSNATTEYVRRMGGKSPSSPLLRRLLRRISRSAGGEEGNRHQVSGKSPDACCLKPSLTLDSLLPKESL